MVETYSASPIWLYKDGWEFARKTHCNAWGVIYTNHHGQFLNCYRLTQAQAEAKADELRSKLASQADLRRHRLKGNTA